MPNQDNLHTWWWGDKGVLIIKHLIRQVIDPPFEFFIFLYLFGHGLVSHGDSGAGNIAEVSPQVISSQTGEVS